LEQSPVEKQRAATDGMHLPKNTENTQMAYAHTVGRHRGNFDDASMRFTRTQDQPMVLVSEASNNQYQIPHTHLKSKQHLI
jgi:hypothetical protein